MGDGRGLPQRDPIIKDIGGLMSLRDKFAGDAINGLLSDPGVMWFDTKTKKFDTDAIRINCDLAFMFADEMLAARDRVKGEVGP
jgi:hypothetical protein